jgi:hypothetical protein
VSESGANDFLQIAMESLEWSSRLLAEDQDTVARAPLEDEKQGSSGERLTRMRPPAAPVASLAGCAAGGIARPSRRFLLLPLVMLAACESPTQEDFSQREVGVYALVSAGGAALPFVEMGGSTRLEILSGSLTIESGYVAQGWRACSFTLEFRESVGAAEAVRQTEAVPCRYSWIFSNIPNFQLDGEAQKVRRFENMAHDLRLCSFACIQGQRGRDFSITITDRNGIPFIFRK